MAIKHLNEEIKNPSRVVILGGSGFLGSELKRKLDENKIPVLSLSSSDINLTHADAAEKLGRLLKPNDAVIMLSAITPDKGRDIATFLKNLNMAATVCSVVKTIPLAHFIYLSSDAVYSQAQSQVIDTSEASPSDLYGMMHKAREMMFQESLTIPLAILRLTITYGVNDTHNSYGPNRFRRMAAKEGKIALFGEGEEKRDHVFVADIIELILAVLQHKSSGILNLASGSSYSFMEVASKVAALFEEPIAIVGSPRKTPITHRHYDVSEIYKAFPKFRFTPLDEGLKLTHQKMEQLVLEESHG